MKLKQAFLAISLFCLAPTAHAATFCGNVERPPAQFMHAPKSPVKIVYLKQRDLNMWVSIAHGLGSEGCGFYNATSHTIYLSERLKNMPVQRAKTIGHEAAHANGWRH